MKKLLLFLMCLLTIMPSVSAKKKVTNQQSQQSNGIELLNLTVEGRVRPMGLDDQKPRFGWQIASDKKCVVQRSYQVQVSANEDFATIVWDSGVVGSDQSQWVEYNGTPLQPNTRYYWQVTVKTNKGFAKSNVQSWSTGMLSASNWKGDWIGYDSITPDVRMERHSRIAARHLRKTFSVSKPVKRATVHVCGLGYYILNINGQRIGDYLLAPAPTQYDKAAIYDTYDVSEELRVKSEELATPTGNGYSGTEANSSLFTLNSSLEAVLAGGYFFPMTQNYQTNVRSAYGMPKLKLNLIVEYEDGTSETIATDSTWQVAVDGPIRYANLYDGTLIDYRRQPSEWMPVQVVEAPCTELRGNTLGGVKTYATEQPVNVVKTGTHCFVLDFATNNTGRIHLPQITIPEGDTVRIRYAETLNADGTLYTANLRSAENTDVFVGNGFPVTMTSEFLWHGFRYIEVTGMKEPDVQRITRQLMTDDLLSAATIEADDGVGMLNKILDNARRGILSNYKGIPMDCPQRDERMPWLGDRTMGCFGESYLTRNHTLYAKWLQDICDAQQESGSISDVSPAYWRLYNGNITWPAALPFGMEMMRLQYGDERPMRKHTDNVKRFLTFAKKKSGKDGLITYDRYGDWCVPPASLDEVLTKDSTRLTDGVLLSSCYYYHICKMMGMDEEAERTKDAINRTFLKDGCYSNGTVTANLLPLAMGIVPDSSLEAVQKNFMKRVTGGKHSPLSPLPSPFEAHIDCGVIGISWLMRYLSRAGWGDIAYQIATTKTYPGWGYMVENGATTIWELWNGNTANPSMNSGNHVMMLGDLIPWVFECLAGIAPDPARPGFKHIIMHPDFGIRQLNGVTATYPSIYGDISSQWERRDGFIRWTVTIPANTTATLYLPNGKKQAIGSGTYHVNISDPLIMRQADARHTAPLVQVARYWGNRQAAISYTFDDGLLEHYTEVLPQLRKRGLKATFGIIGSKVGRDQKGTPCMTWQQLREMTDDGQEIASHGWEHRNLTKLEGEALRHEVQHNDTVIHDSVGVWPRTFIFPGNAKSPAAAAYASCGRVATRVRQVSLGSKRTADWCRQWVRQLLGNGEWGITMTHGITCGYDAFSNPQVLWNHLDDVCTLHDSIWVATFHDVAAYVKERDAIRLEVIRHQKNVEVQPFLPLDHELYHQPLTLIIPDGSTRVRQNGHRLKTYRSGGCLCVDINPHGGSLTFLVFAAP